MYVSGRWLSNYSTFILSVLNSINTSVLLEIENINPQNQEAFQAMKNAKMVSLRQLVCNLPQQKHRPVMTDQSSADLVRTR